MKISNRTHLPLTYLDNGIKGKIEIYEKDIESVKNSMFLIIEQFNTFKYNFKKEINIVSNPFFDAVIFAQSKLAKLYLDINEKENISIDGTYIFSGITYFISFRSNPLKDNVDFILLGFNKNGSPVLFYKGDETNTYTWVSKLYQRIENIKDQEFADNILYIICYFYLFKKYADVEVKIMKANTHEKSINCKYINDTKSDIIILDSKWFTELVNSNSFSVRGHFRLQPKKKDGEWTKELIWISDFTKNGYHRKATIEQ